MGAIEENVLFFIMYLNNFQDFEFRKRGKRRSKKRFFLVFFDNKTLEEFRTTFKKCLLSVKTSNFVDVMKALRHKNQYYKNTKG